MAEKTINGIPQMGYGTWNRSPDEAYQGVLWALEAGCRHIDTAQGYRNEEAVGRAIRDSGIARADIYITTKIAPENFAAGEPTRTALESLDKLGIDQVDLLLLHWPSIKNEYPMPSYVGELTALHDNGRARMIGVSNFTIPLIDEAIPLFGGRPIATNQCEIHVFFQNRKVAAHCAAKGIPMTAYSPLARGAVKNDPVLTEIGNKHGATDAQVALAFLMHEGRITIPSSGKKERIAANFAARNISLDDQDVTRIRALDKHMRLVNGPWCPVWDD
ncbi:MAG: aldo/keto reductase [Hyphomicrobiaceae bacterium]|nr:aldo/keto reductase [Hyphomicrobiaceae bacterium]